MLHCQDKVMTVQFSTIYPWGFGCTLFSKLWKYDKLLWTTEARNLTKNGFNSDHSLNQDCIVVRVKMSVPDLRLSSQFRGCSKDILWNYYLKYCLYRVFLFSSLEQQLMNSIKSRLLEYKICKRIPDSVSFVGRYSERTLNW